jgi:glycerol kinase
VQWLRDELRFFDSSDQVEELALSVADTDGVYVVPAFAGLGAPHWNQEARGLVTGLSRGSSKAHIARAALESIAYQTRDVLECMEADSGLKIEELRVDGGATVNDMLMQFQSDILQSRIIRPGILESTAMGAAFLAGICEGFWGSIDEIQDIWKMDRAFDPRPMDEDLQNKLQGWQRSVETALHWAKTD